MCKGYVRKLLTLGRYVNIEVYDERYITGITFLDKDHPIDETKEDSEVVTHCVDELERYLSGELKEFTVPIHFENEGSPFQHNVWRELLNIPYGETISYKTLAERCGGANYARAVASANGYNRIPILIPCHRVISSDGSLGGYSGGIDIKHQLLTIEGVNIP